MTKLYDDNVIFSTFYNEAFLESNVHVRVRSRLGIEIFRDQDLDSGTDSDIHDSMNHERGHVCPSP